jgi:hypothetical protein
VSSIEGISVGSDAVPVVIIACRVLLVWVSSKMVDSDVLVSSIGMRVERDVWVAGMDVPSSVCEDASVSVVEVEVEDEVEDRGVEDEEEDGGLLIAAVFVVTGASALVTTVPVPVLLPELASQLDVSTLVRLKYASTDRIRRMLSWAGGPKVQANPLDHEFHINQPAVLGTFLFIDMINTPSM